MDRFMNILMRMIKIFIVFNLATLCIIVFLNVIGRIFFDSLIWTVEISRFLFVYLTFFSAIVALKENSHFRVDLLVNTFSMKIQRWFEVFGNLLILFVLYLFFQGSWKLIILNWNNTDPITGISYSFLYGVGIITSVLMALIILSNLYQMIFVKDYTSPIRAENLDV